MDIKKAKDLVKNGQVAVVVFTKGPFFNFDTVGNGETGNWVVKKENFDKVDLVIIYQRDEESGVNRIFLGNYAGIRHSPEAKRYVIQFSKLTEVGVTSSNWIEFADASQYPVRYVGDFH